MENSLPKDSFPELGQITTAKEKDLSSDSDITEKNVTSATEKFGLYYPELDKSKETKLNVLLEEVNTKASINYRNQKLLDIQTNVRTMLERVVTKINNRGIFKISRIQPCGSMTERTAVWKYGEGPGEERYTEFDYLAILDYSPEIIRCDLGCGQCVGVSELPVPGNTLYEYGINRLISNYNRVMYDRLFLRVLNVCLGSACDCFSVEYDDNNVYSSFTYQLAERCKSDYRCKECVVEMPTGNLRVDDSISIGRGPKDANCSLAFRWTSRVNTLSVCDKLLQEEAENITSLSIHVDFLPALEILKDKPDFQPTLEVHKDKPNFLPALEIPKTKLGEDAREHNFFLVPKHCKRRHAGEHWRKSNCMAEIAYIVNIMSEKHKKCYKIIKYVISRLIDDYSNTCINWYYVKTVALNHSRECSDSSEGCAECVLKILAELNNAYGVKTLNSFHDSDVNMFDRSGADLEYMFQIIITRLCSVNGADSCRVLLQA